MNKITELESLCKVQPAVSEETELAQLRRVVSDQIEAMSAAEIRYKAMEAEVDTLRRTWWSPAATIVSAVAPVTPLGVPSVPLGTAQEDDNMAVVPPAAKRKAVLSLQESEDAAAEAETQAAEA